MRRLEADVLELGVGDRKAGGLQGRRDGQVGRDDIRRERRARLPPCTFPVPSLYLPCTFPAQESPTSSTASADTKPTPPSSSLDRFTKAPALITALMLILPHS